MQLLWGILPHSATSNSSLGNPEAFVNFDVLRAFMARLVLEDGGNFG